MLEQMIQLIQELIAAIKENTAAHAGSAKVAQPETAGTAQQPAGVKPPPRAGKTGVAAPPQQTAAVSPPPTAVSPPPGAVAQVDDKLTNPKNPEEMNAALVFHFNRLGSRAQIDSVLRDFGHPSVSTLPVSEYANVLSAIAKFTQ